jgi:hypothetical protein
MYRHYLAREQIVMRSLVKKTVFRTTLLSIMSTVAIWIPMVLQTNAAIAGDKIYKIEIRETDGIPQTLNGERYKKIRGRSEWAVLKVNDGGTVLLKHVIRTTNSYGVSTWSNDVIISLNVCPIMDQRSPCINLKGDRFTMPKGNSVKDFRFEFQVQENNGSQVRFVQVPRDFIAEESPDINNSRSQ